MGLLGIASPRPTPGLGGGSYVVYALFAREVERGDAGYRSMMSIQSSLVTYPIYAYGSEAQTRKYLPKLTSGEWIGLTEPNAGSGLRHAELTRKTAGGYVLSGAETWITISPIADVFVV